MREECGKKIGIGLFLLNLLQKRDQKHGVVMIRLVDRTLRWQGEDCFQDGKVGKMEKF